MFLESLPIWQGDVFSIRITKLPPICAGDGISDEIEGINDQDGDGECIL